MKRLFTWMKRLLGGVAELDSRTACRPTENPTRK